MNWKTIAFGLLIMAYTPHVRAQELTPLGQWTDHFPYRSAIRVGHYNGEIIAATPLALFTVNVDDSEIKRKSVVNGLSDVSVTDISTSPEAVIIVYSSGNIDILSNQKITNVENIRKAALNKNIRVYDVYASEENAYISTSYGISVLDIAKKEISATYIIGNSGEEINVYQSVIFHDTIYAATEKGIKKAPVEENNLQDYRSWTNDFYFDGNQIRYILSDGNNLVAVKQDSIFIKRNNNWNLIYVSQNLSGEPFLENNKLTVPEIHDNEGRLVVLSLEGSLQSVIKNLLFIKHPKQLYSNDGKLWIADSLAGLSYFSESDFQSFVPSSPDVTGIGIIDYSDRKLYFTESSIGPDAIPPGKPGTVQIFEERHWKKISAENQPALASVKDIVTLTHDVRNGSTWMGSFGDGLLHLGRDNQLSIFKNGSFISPAVFNPLSFRVAGLALDQEHNLWISNYGAMQSLVVRKDDGDIIKFRPPFPLIENALSEIIIDDVNQKWIISPKDNGLVVFNHGQNPDNPADDQWKLYKQGSGLGNLPSNRILSLAKDRDGFIWVGTDNGIGIIYCPERVFTTEGCEAVLPVIQEGNFPGYLFRRESVQTIAVDAANRKWIGTKNGVWLISANGEKTLLRFTKNNSPLPEDDIQQIGIDHYTGEVYFATTMGMVSYRSSATEEIPGEQGVLAFPNPVPPGYTGSIAIRGLPLNAIVKITEPNGRLVYQLRSSGSQAVWDGKDYRGRSISPGVYFIFATDNQGNEKKVGKIAIAR